MSDQPYSIFLFSWGFITCNLFLLQHLKLGMRELCLPLSAVYSNCQLFIYLDMQDFQITLPLMFTITILFPCDWIYQPIKMTFPRLLKVFWKQNIQAANVHTNILQTTGYIAVILFLFVVQIDLLGVIYVQIGKLSFNIFHVRLQIILFKDNLPKKSSRQLISWVCQSKNGTR